MQVERKVAASPREAAVMPSSPGLIPAAVGVDIASRQLGPLCSPPAEARSARSPLALLGGVERVHVVGVAGTGLRGIALLLDQKGVKVTGSELWDSPVLESFRLRGIECCVGHSSLNVGQGTNLVLVSAAVDDDNPEVRTAVARSIPILKYAECLGSLMAERIGIGVAGTHGKTTTTAMVSYILSEGGLDPSFVIGGEHPGLGGSARWGQGPYFVAEACEFDRSFLNLRPKISIVTNIEEDHLDYFESLKEIQGAFAKFVSMLPEDGYLVLNRDDPNSSYLSEFCRSRVGTFSLRAGAADWWAEDVAVDGSGSRFRLVGQNGEASSVRLSIPGAHNVANALAATAVCRHAGVPMEKIAAILPSFTGVRRRFEVLARSRVMVVDDYAHHPTEIHSVVRAARAHLAGRRLIAVFQPHQHSRLRSFLPQFAEALAQFDASLVVDVYRARDKDEDVRAVRSSLLVEKLNELSPATPALYTPLFADALEALRQCSRPRDVVIFMGAGSITELARIYARELEGHNGSSPTV